MAFKFVVFAAALAYANAGLLGAPAVAYSAAPAVSTAYLQHAAPVVAAAPVAYASPAIGASHQSVVRSPLGNQAVSQYTKSVDTAFSSVRKFDTRITNDALAVAHAPVAAYAAHAAPVVSTYAAHAPVVSTYAAHAPVVSTYAAHAPVVSAYAAHAPVVSAHVAAPVLRTAAVGYSPAAVVSHATFSGLGASYAW